MKTENEKTTLQKIDKVLATLFFIVALTMVILLPLELQKQETLFKASGFGFTPNYEAYIILELISVLICFITLRFIIKKQQIKTL